MKITRKTKELMTVFNKYKHHLHLSPTAKSNQFFLRFRQDLLEAWAHLKEDKKQGRLANVSSKRSDEIIKPRKFNSKSFPSSILQHIETHTKYMTTMKFAMFGRNITIHFFDETEPLHRHQEDFEAIYLWIFLLSKYASQQCSTTLILYLYMSSLEKTTPSDPSEILSENHVNTAFTTTCPRDSEIVVFRKEEWFKVFLHETMHNFALDFSDMDTTIGTQCIQRIFDVPSDVTLFETYTEFWAEMINAQFCTFFSLKDKMDKEEYLDHVSFFINFERTYSFFQMIKVLKHMQLQYKDLFSTSEKSRQKRHANYKEGSNVLAYYILKTILLNNYNGFLNWCLEENGDNRIQFRKTMATLRSFCGFIENNYKSKSMLSNTNATESFWDTLYEQRRFQSSAFMRTLRMTICELCGS